MEVKGKGTRLVRRNGVFYIVWTGNTRGRSTGTRNRADAERALAAFIQEGSKVEQVIGGYTVHQAIEDYLIEHIRLNAESRETPEFIADRLHAWFPVEMRIADFREEDGMAYIEARRSCKVVLTRAPKPASDGALRRELGFLSAAFNHAARKKRVSKHDLPTIPMPAPPPPRDRYLTVEEEKQLVDACQVETVPTKENPAPRLTRIYRFLILALETAARKEALETLTWFQIDFNARTINLNPPGRRQTNKRRAVVRMSTRLHAMLERAFKEKKTAFVLDHDGAIRTSFENLVAKSGLEDVSPHILRHTWATRAAQAGVPMREIADWLGDDIQTVEKNYYKRSPHYLKAAIDWREREGGNRATTVPEAPTGDTPQELSHRPTPPVKSAT